MQAISDHNGKGEWTRMDQTCDRCGPTVRAAYRVVQEGEFYLCRHCTTRLRAALSAAGWAILPIGRHAPVPPVD